MFNAYQQDLERIGGEAKERWEILGQGIAQVLSAGSDEDKEKTLGEFLALLRRFDLNMKESIDEMENQLKLAGLSEEAKKDILFLREHLMVDPQTLTTHALEEFMFRLITAQTIETRIRLALTSKRRNELFGPYLRD